MVKNCGEVDTYQPNRKQNLKTFFYFLILKHGRLNILQLNSCSSSQLFIICNNDYETKSNNSQSLTLTHSISQIWIQNSDLFPQTVNFSFQIHLFNLQKAFLFGPILLFQSHETPQLQWAFNPRFGEFGSWRRGIEDWLQRASGSCKCSLVSSAS